MCQGLKVWVGGGHVPTRRGEVRQLCQGRRKAVVNVVLRASNEALWANARGALACRVVKDGGIAATSWSLSAKKVAILRPDSVQFSWPPAATSLSPKNLCSHLIGTWLRVNERRSSSQPSWADVPWSLVRHAVQRPCPCLSRSWPQRSPA